MASKAAGDIESTLVALHKHLPKIPVPSVNDRVFKDECVYSFDSPVSILTLLYKMRTILISICFELKSCFSGI